MKFYYSTGTCSTACHIALEEAQMAFTPIEVSFKRDLNVSELDMKNPLGAVPTLEIEPGKVLSQNAAILAYIAEKTPSLSVQGSWERLEMIQWLAYLASDFQRAFTPLFASEMMTKNEEAQKEIEAYGKENMTKHLDFIEQSLNGKDYILGKSFSVVDCYLFTIASWCKWVDIEFSQHKNLSNYMSRIYQRPAVQKVLKIEDLLD